MRLVAYAGSEEQPIARSGTLVVAKAQGPQPIVFDGMSTGIAKEAIEAATLDVINSDLPASGIADQQVVAE